MKENFNTLQNYFKNGISEPTTVKSCPYICLQRHQNFHYSSHKPTKKHIHIHTAKSLHCHFYVNYRDKITHVIFPLSVITMTQTSPVINIRQGKRKVMVQGIFQELSSCQDCKWITILYIATWIYFDIDIFVNCNWVNTRWQWYSTHLQINNTQNKTNNN